MPVLDRVGVGTEPQLTREVHGQVNAETVPRFVRQGIHETVDPCASMRRELRVFTPTRVNPKVLAAEET